MWHLENQLITRLCFSATTFDLYARGGAHYTQAALGQKWTQAANMLNTGMTPMQAVSGGTFPWGGAGSPPNLYYLSTSGVFTQPTTQTTPSMAPTFSDQGHIVGSRTAIWQQTTAKQKYAVSLSVFLFDEYFMFLQPPNLPCRFSSFRFPTLERVRVQETGQLAVHHVHPVGRRG